MLVTSRVTRTGGRDAATRHIPPQLALSVGKPERAPPEGWQWSALTDLARLESGHTPSRKHPEYWGGDIPWISIGDARAHDGQRIDDTEEKTNELGIENSSARILPTNTVCLSRTASVGYVVVMGRPMATSQDFVNWVCSKPLDHNFLKYLFIAEDEDLLRFASGAVHQTIYFPEVKAFHICHPPLAEQQRIVGVLDEALAGLSTAQAHAESNLQSVFTQRGEGWVSTTLGQATGGIFTGPFGSLLHKSDYVANGIPLVNPAHITEVGMQPDLRKTVSKETAGRLSNYVMREGDIVIGRRGEMGRCALVTEVEEGWLCGTGSFFIKPSSRCDASYLVRFLRSVGCKQELEKIAGGAVMPNLSNTDLGNFRFYLPPLEQQKKIVRLVEALHTETQRLESFYQQKQAALAALRKSLLHQAFSDEL